MVNIAADVWAHADTIPDKVAVRARTVSPEGATTRDLTFRELREANQQVAGAVVQAGLQPGDRVLFIAPTIMAFPVVYYGLHAAGVVVITMNTMSTKAEIDFVVQDSGASLVIAWHQCAGAARQSTEASGIPLWVVDDTTTYDAPPVTTAHEHAADDTCLILYTSGTTGRPKGAELTAANLTDTGPSFYPVLNSGPDDRFGTGLPLFHVFGQCVVMNATLAHGAELSILYPFEPRAMLQMIVDHELTAVSGVPTMWNFMLHAAGDDYTAADFATLNLASSGGASLPVEVIRAFEAKFGCTILEGYGLTETNGAATFNDINRPQKAGTVGPPLPGTTIEIRSLDGETLPPDEIGEVFVKGPTVFKGYRNRPDATAENLTDGWLHTGDLGTLDADGYLRIIDRTKDLIIRGGYNVYPREVEEVLYTHPEIVEAAVLGIPDERYGEEIAAVVVRTPGSQVSSAELDSLVRQKLSAYKVPRVYHFVDELPKGATGKILKRAIDREPLEQGRSK